MKYLSSNNLYFRIGDIDTGLTPTNLNTSYTLELCNPLTHIVIKRYNGQFFYYSNDQRIFYDFLLDAFVQNDFDIETYPNVNTHIVPVYEVVITIGSYADTELVSRTILPDDVDESDITDKIYPTGGTPYMISAKDFDCEEPLAADGLNFPSIVYTGNMTVAQLQGDMIVLSDGSRQYPLALNGCFTFQPNNLNINLSHQGLIIQRQHFQEYCDAPYMVVWFDERGFFNSQPFYGNESDTYTHNTTTDLQHIESKYQTQEARSWTLQSDYVRKQQTYKGLFTSPAIWIYDIANKRYYKAILTNTNYNESRTKKAFRFNITLNNDVSKIYR